MWTDEHRARALAQAKKRKRYPSDLTDEKWIAIDPLMPPLMPKGRHRAVNLREIVNAIRYLVRAGCSWRMLPAPYPPWPTVHWWFRRFVRRLLFQLIHDIAVRTDRERNERHVQPTATVLDSQSMKAPYVSRSGYDAGKKIKGRKRHIAVETNGHLLMVNMTSADISDAAGAHKVLDAVKTRWPWVKHLFAGSAYDHMMLMDKAATLDFVVEVVHKNAVLSRCRAAGWLSERSAG